MNNLKLLFSGINKYRPTKKYKTVYTLSEHSFGKLPWKGKAWRRVFQPGQDPDWAPFLPWAQKKSSPENIQQVSDGVRIWVKNGVDGVLYSNFGFKYGKVTARIKFTRIKGVWSAFWLYPDNDQPEHDFEHCGGKGYVNVTHHWGYSYQPKNKKQTKRNKRRLKNPEGFNDYSIEVTPYGSVYRINDKVVRVMTESISNNNQHIILSAGNGDYCGNIKADGFMLVNKVTVEVYK